jgi:hypothetical protein
MTSACGLLWQKFVMLSVGLRLVSARSWHGKFAPTVQAYITPFMQRQDVL